MHKLSFYTSRAEFKRRLRKISTPAASSPRLEPSRLCRGPIPGAVIERRRDIEQKIESEQGGRVAARDWTLVPGRSNEFTMFYRRRSIGGLTHAFLCYFYDEQGAPIRRRPDELSPHRRP
jgi:hypothetical protein